MEWQLLLLSWLAVMTSATCATCVPTTDGRKDAQDADVKARAKRQGSKDYHIDVIVLLDYAFYRHWLNLKGPDSEAAERDAKEYMAHIFQGINHRYRAITNLPFQLHVHLTSVVIAKSASDSPWTEEIKYRIADGVEEVRAEDALYRLQAIAKANYNKYDHVMAITQYNLFGENTNTSGLALLGSMCSEGSSLSIVEDGGPALTEYTCTHELGHSFGALHDGVDNECSSTDGYVMSNGGSPITDINRFNFWRFSNCSAQYFQTSIQQLINRGDEESCLLRKLDPEDVPHVNSSLPIEVDEQCHYIYNASSYFCRDLVLKPEDICLKLTCANPASRGTCSVTPAATGTCCGQGKSCQDGRCVAEPRSQEKCDSFKETCPFGDQPGILLGGTDSCNQLPAQYCYEQTVNKKCCQTCENINTNISGCEYGDKVQNCAMDSCSSMQSYKEACCNTCSHVTPPPCTGNGAGTIEISLPSGSTSRTTCEQILGGLCCMPEISQYCPCTCAKEKRNDEACPYGDCAVEGCDLLRIKNTCTVDERAKCCQTCQEIEANTTTTKNTPPTTTSKTTPTTTTSRTTPTTTTSRTTPTTTTSRTTPTTTTSRTTPTTTSRTTPTTTSRTTPTTTTTSRTTPTTTTSRTTPTTTTTSRTTPTTTTTSRTTPTTTTTSRTTPSTTTTSRTTPTTTTTSRTAPTTTTTSRTTPTTTTSRTTPTTTTTSRTTPTTTTTSRTTPTTTTTSRTTPTTTTTSRTTPTTTTTSRTTPTTTTTSRTTPTTTTTSRTTPTTTTTSRTAPTTTTTSRTAPTTTTTSRTTPTTTSRTTPTTTSRTTPTTTTTSRTTPTTTTSRTTPTTTTTSRTTPTTTTTSRTTPTTTTTSRTTPTTTTTSRTTPTTTSRTTPTTTSRTTPTTTTTSRTTPTTTTSRTTPTTTTTSRTAPTTTTTSRTTPTTTSRTTPTTTSRTTPTTTSNKTTVYTITTRKTTPTTPIRITRSERCEEIPGVITCASAHMTNDSFVLIMALLGCLLLVLTA